MNRAVKRLTAAFAAAIMLSAASVGAAAASRSDPNMISINTANGQAISDAVNKIAEGIFEHRADIDLTSYGFKQEVGQEIVNVLMIKYPEIFFLDRQVPAYLKLQSGNLVGIAPSYRYSKEETDGKLSEFYRAADRYLSLVSSSMTDLEKALVLHDAIVDDVTYILDEENSSDYELIINGRGICEDYSRVYAYLLGQLGIRTEIVDSDEMLHEWMKVNIGGVYYHVDITWDDPQPDRAGRVSHKFFLLSDERISDKGYYEPHKDFKCVNDSWSTTYDGGVFQLITSKTCPVGGRPYFVYNGSGGYYLGTGSFREGYDTAALSFTPLVSLADFKWSSGKGRNWIGNYSALIEYGGKLYYNSADEVFSYDPATGKTGSVYKLKKAKKELFGLRIRGGRLYGVLSDSPTGSETEKMLLSLSGNNFGARKQQAKASQKTKKLKKDSLPARTAELFSIKTRDKDSKN